MNTITLDLTQNSDLSSFFTNRASGQVVTLDGVRIQITEITPEAVNGIVEKVTLPDRSDELGEETEEEETFLPAEPVSEEEGMPLPPMDEQAALEALRG